MTLSNLQNIYSILGFMSYHNPSNQTGTVLIVEIIINTPILQKFYLCF